MVHLDEPYRAVSPRGTMPYPTLCLTGVRSAPAVMEAPAARSRVVAVLLHPAGARVLLARPLSEVSGRTVDLGDLLGRGGLELAERCHDARSAAERIATVRRWLASRLTPRPRGPGRAGDVAAWATAQIVRHRGALPIDALRDRTGLSWARLAGVFRDQVGVTPKRYARIVRFRHAVTLVHESPDLPLTALALAAGYYDQAHMSAEFRALGRLTPGALRSSARYPDAVSVAEARA